MSKDVTPAERIVHVARLLLERNIGFLEGVRCLAELRHLVKDPEDDVFATIRAIDSQTDHFPLGEVRKRTAEGALARMDGELEQFALRSSPELDRACVALIERYGRQF